MSFSDIFKSSFLDNVAAVTLPDMLLALVLAFGIGMFIFLIYKKTYAGVMYSSSFGVTLVALTMITTLVILAVTSNVVLSLGMVGALSIVRFRTAIKEPLDIAFLFWSIAVGIVLAAGFLLLWIEASGMVGAIETKQSLTATVAGVGDGVNNIAAAMGADEIVNYGVSELSQRVNERIERTANRTIIVCIILMLLTSALAYFITERTMQDVSGRRGPSRRRDDGEGYSTSTRYEDF